jgi:hypothetical protein
MGNVGISELLVIALPLVLIIAVVVVAARRRR